MLYPQATHFTNQAIIRESSLVNNCPVNVHFLHEDLQRQPLRRGKAFKMQELNMLQDEDKVIYIHIDEELNYPHDALEILAEKYDKLAFSLTKSRKFSLRFIQMIKHILSPNTYLSIGIDDLKQAFSISANCQHVLIDSYDVEGIEFGDSLNNTVAILCIIRIRKELSVGDFLKLKSKVMTSIGDAILAIDFIVDPFIPEDYCVDLLRFLDQPHDYEHKHVVTLLKEVKLLSKHENLATQLLDKESELSLSKMKIEFEPCDKQPYVLDHIKCERAKLNGPLQCSNSDETFKESDLIDSPEGKVCESCIETMLGTAST